MAFNVYTPSITYLLQQIANGTLMHNGVLARSKAHSTAISFTKLYFLLNTALNRALATQLSNQDTPQELSPIEIDPENAPHWAQRALDAGETIYAFHPDEDTLEAIMMVADWIFASIARSDPWLSRTDDQGRPFKLLKLGTLHQALAEATKLTASTFPDQNDESTGTDTILKFPDGMRVVQLLTPGAMRAEGYALGHCLAQGQQDTKLAQGSHAYYSLRDLYGNSHVTMEILRGDLQQVLIQVRGKQNKLPIPKYTPYVIAFAEALNLELVDRIAMTGLIKQRGIFYDVGNLPTAFHYMKSLDLSEMPNITLPDHLTIDGHLFLSGSAITALPAHLTVTGSINLWNSSVETIGPALAVADTLMAHETRLTTLPPRTRIGDYLNLARSKISSLPPDLFVGGDLDLEETPIAAIPPSIQVIGKLNLTGTPVQRTASPVLD